ncbi:peptidylprolyl isomerase [Sphaerochaeta sp. PS]|uniref:peptidylprolyl isomerase n=1 Tax=Sphaerochaeta sp. PS TaxID=3076336 RepID=UPI0028A2F2ED|nr:peptidylprolyl isomerase [Sphaerochaeta sp. PS]MDT4761528.1 peptidylprolyl isomerase [Sphaerochaeta sp. PS]
MKRFLVLAICFSLISASTLFAAAIGAPAATVRLTKTTPITVAELETEVKKYQDSAVKSGTDPATVDPLQVLNLLINNELYRQGAARDGVKVTDAMIDQAYASQKANIESSYGQKLTDEEFAKVINSNFGTVDAYRKMIGEQLMVDTYVRMKKAADLNKPITISETDIASYYRKNKTQFVSPETVKLSHIFIPFTDDEKTNSDNKALLETVAQQLKSGSLTFEKAVVQYSKDDQSKMKAGDIGWLTMDNTEAMAGLGETFFDVAFTTEVGDTSSVVTSNTGYHILKILAYNETKILGLTDQINPNTTSTIHDYIQSQLTGVKQQEVYYGAINALVDDLRKSATVNILYKK